ncbi:MAG: selenocysteine-specific translation elongation factor [Byssovorax sp.]
MRRFVLGTAGHVDHGKTTLVRALTGVDTDRLPEEKRRGITIELGFAPWTLGSGIEVSLIDVPGHRKLVHTMIAGAIGIELVLLVVAADEGVMPQTREHVAACELLGIKRAVIAVTKLDRAGPELAALAGEEAAELCRGRFETEVVLCSARTGEGIDAVRAAVERALRALPPPPHGGRARLSVDRVFSVKGAGTVVTGTLVEGKIALGAPLFVAGAEAVQGTSARGLHIHDKAVPIAEAPTRLAVNLAGLAVDAVHRGDLVTDDGRVRATRVIDVSLRADAKLRRGQGVSLYVGTAHTTARVSPIAEPEAAPAVEEAPAKAAKKAPRDAAPEPPQDRLYRLRLSQPLVVIGGDRFVLRGSDIDGPNGAVLGGGVVLDADPPKKRPRDKRRAALAALLRGEPAATMRALVEELAPRPLASGALGARFVVGAEALRKAGESLSHKGEITAIKGHGWIARDRLLDLAARARALVIEHHARAPLDRGLGTETLRQKLGALAGPEAAEAAIRLAAEKTGDLKGEPLVIEGDIARMPGGAALGGAVAGALAVAIRCLAEAGLKGMTELAMKEATGAQPREVKAILAKMVREKQAVHTGELWFSRASFDALRDKVLAHLAASPKITIAEMKEMTGLGRKQIIVLLEQLDREGVTRREGDDRVPAR